jgi:alpha-glucosidase
MTGVVYQIYPRSFDRDLAGITARLDYVAALGVDAIWLTPFYPSPQADNGYDVSDYCDVDPRYGTLADFDALLARAHHLGLRVIIDVVPNHCSSEHPLFRAALAAGPGSSERARFHFSRTPNNWPSVFGGSAWTAVDEESYLHLCRPARSRIRRTPAPASRATAAGSRCPGRPRHCRW